MTAQQLSGWQIAEQRIAEEAEKRTGTLDLHGLGLSEFPASFFSSGVAGRIQCLVLRDRFPWEHDADKNPHHIETLLADSRLRACPNIQALDCSFTRLNDLSVLADLTQLTELNCSDTQINDLTPLTGLSQLTELNCSRTKINDLTALAGLSQLTQLDCSYTQIHDLTPLTGLSQLTQLNCSGTKINDLTPLTGLSQLTQLDCSDTQINDLTSLTGLSQLTELNCSHTQIHDLTPLTGLSQLTELNCSHTQINDLTPLTGLSQLTQLDCSGTGVSNLSPLLRILSLRVLGVFDCPVADIPKPLFTVDRLENLYFRSEKMRLPDEVCSSASYDDCLARLRAHFADLEAGSVPLREAKLVVLGNGQIGKTQICRRLQGQDYDASVASTHGITVSQTTVQPAEPAAEAIQLNLWDFGGQDLYHGTHALFLRSQAVFMLVWTTTAEQEAQHEAGGQLFRNERLPYWLNYLKASAKPNSSLLIVQNQCDTPEQEGKLLVDAEAILSEAYIQRVNYSAKENRHRPALDNALIEAVQCLREREGVATIGVGRMKVRQQLLQWLHEDAQRPEAERHRRTISMAEFEQLCEQVDGVSSPALLLRYLHDSGIVFCREGLFNDQVVLDQSWALNAIYTVFDREKSYDRIRKDHGRFDRDLLELVVWQDYTIDEQQLFIEMMLSCGICFKFQEEDEKNNVEARYIAPELLPPRTDKFIQGELSKLGVEAELPALTLRWQYPFLHSGIIRQVIAQLGEKAGEHGVYWQDGLCLFEARSATKLVVQCHPDTVEDNDVTHYGGAISARFYGNSCNDFAAEMFAWFNNLNEHLGYDNIDYDGPEFKPRVDGHGHELKDAPPLLTGREFAAQPRDPNHREVCVSYAWGPEAERDSDVCGTVDMLCEKMGKAGIDVTRDKNTLEPGASIREFMERIGRADHVFIILTDDYLRSENCMFELLGVWREAKQDLSEFLKKAQVFRSHSAKISKTEDRLAYALYWRATLDRQNDLVRRLGSEAIGYETHIKIKRIGEFVNHCDEILGYVAGRLKPHDFDEFFELTVQKVLEQARA